MLFKNKKIYELGDNILAFGDSRDAGLVDKLIGDKKIALILTDPPYGVSYVESKANFVDIKRDEKVIQNDSFSNEDQYKHFTIDWLSVVMSHLKDKNSFYIFNSDKMIFSLKEAMDELEFRFAQILIWVKGNHVLGRRDYLAKHELIAYGWCGTHNFHKSKDRSVLFYPKPNRNPLHPTTKPLGLIRRLILNSTKIGDIVYDPFGGSGTVLIACEQTRRRCITVEIDDSYCKTIINRYQRLKGGE